jgi:hypothetical protein
LGSIKYFEGDFVNFPVFYLNSIRLYSIHINQPMGHRILLQTFFFYDI